MLNNPRSHILFTGGTGFFGLALMRHWQNLGSSAPEVTVLSRNPERFVSLYPELADTVNLLKSDVIDQTSFPRAGKFTHMLHAAADSTLGPGVSPMERFNQIVEGTRNALNFCLHRGVDRCLFVSSGAVYGPQPEHLEKIPEGFHGMPDPLDPMQSYGVAKRCAEHLCALYGERYQLQTVIARCFAFVGPDLPVNVHFAIGNFIRDALSAPEITIRGDGTPIRSYMDQRDLANWLQTLLLHGKAGQAYNVGNDVSISITDLAHSIRDLLSPEKAVRVLGDRVPNKAVNRYVPAVQKARFELQLVNTHTLQDAILRAATGISASMRHRTQ